MSNVIVIQFVTIDGVVSDPDGRDGDPGGGWAFRHGPAAVVDDKFRLGSILDTGVLLFGRRTWAKFSLLWPNRPGDFADVMNRIPKVVASRSTLDLGAWANSSRLDGELVEGTRKLSVDHDVVVLGSTSIVHQLAAAGAVDEYRLLVFPTALGEGNRLFAQPAELELQSADPAGPAVLLRYTTGVATDSV